MSVLTHTNQIVPRPYQTGCVNALWDYFANGGTGNPVCSLPTGTGKSLIPALFMHRAFQAYPFSRMLCLTHVKELIEQNTAALKRVWPTAPVGIYSAGLGEKNGRTPIVMGGIASVKNKISEIGHRDLLFVDEAHLISDSESSMYQTVIAELRRYNPNMKVIGFSATPFRMGQGLLTEGTIFTDLVYDMCTMDAFNSLIDDYYLSPLIPKRVDNIIDVSDVRLLANDFHQGELTTAACGVTQRALQETMQLAANRKSWLVFGSGIANCEQITELLLQMGVNATYVHSKLDSDQRDSRIEGFKAGRFKAIVSNNILTTGFDHPATDCIVDLRPTTSVVLHVQKYGRGTRPFYHPSFSFEQLRDCDNRRRAIEMGGKQNCIVLDFAGNTNRLGPINDPRIPSRKTGGGGEAPVKICDECGSYNHTVARYCVGCGAEFIFRTKIKPTASTAEIIATGETPVLEETTDIREFKVDSVFPKIHRKKDKPPTLQLQYRCGFAFYSVWLSFEGKPFAKHHAHNWWRQHHGEEFPDTAQEAYEQFRECRTADRIKVDFASNPKYPNITEFLF